MSTTTVLKQLLDAHVSEAKPAENFGKMDRLRLSAASSSQQQAYLFFGSLPHPGVYVIAATLRLVALSGFSSQTLTTKRVITPWKERTLTWRTRPTVSGTHAVASATGTLAPNDVFEIDVTDLVRDALLGGGLPFYGFQITTAATGLVSFRSSEDPKPLYRPQLTIAYAVTPTVAADLVPGDGDVVSIATPVLSWTYFDLDGDEQGEFQVQINDTSDFASPDFDSGWLTSTDPQLDLADTAYGGISDGDDAYWRVRVQDDTGQISGWSDAVHVSRVAKGTLTLNAPSATVEETTPTITTTLTGQDQRAIAYTLEEARDDGTFRQVWSLPRTPAPVADGDQYSFRVPLLRMIGREGQVKRHSPIRLRDHDYRLVVQSWDTVAGRVATSGDPTYLAVQRTFQWNNAADSPAAPVVIVATADGPGVVLYWERAAVPDTWALLVDGEIVQDHVDATEWQVV